MAMPVKAWELSLATFIYSPPYLGSANTKFVCLALSNYQFAFKMKEESLLSINTYSHCSVDIYAEQQQTYPLIKKKETLLV